MMTHPITQAGSHEAFPTGFYPSGFKENGAGIWTPHAERSIISGRRQGIDNVMIFDTNSERAEVAHAACREGQAESIEIIDFDETTEAMKDYRAMIEHALSKQRGVLVIVNFFAMRVLQEVQQAIRATENGTRTWIATCESPPDVKTRKHKLGIDLETLHIRWNPQDPRLFADRMRRALSA